MIQALIVDDESLVRKGMRLLFPWDRYGIAIAGEAATGQKALEFIRSRPVQLLLTDITMPGMSGLELIKEVQRHDSSIKVVILTCHQDFDFIQEALRLGAVDYIVKTQLEKLDLDQTMERMLRAVRQEAPANEASGGTGASSLRRKTEEAEGVAWIVDDALFGSLMEALRDAGRREASDWARTAALSFKRWKLSFPMYDWHEESAPPTEPEALEIWWRKLRGNVQGWLRRSGYSEDVISAIVKAVERIVSQAGAHLKQSEISQSVSLSKSYFSTSFRDITRMTFTHFLQTVAIGNACEMLLMTNYPVYSIAEKCGFADQRYFSKMFKDQTGLLPSEYRQAHQERG
ncbi:response regulator transcription factor [Cohnella zeiphila]|uniref:Response regulator n=1 Tax=Cohnella zeiphila TaxID=2761120 RepID=A0A7X0SK70_9BACL|nr:response regulator [Cohnella zeiphila]MBB6730215.1 response regulator [Cohnella zeiphila]